MGCSMIRLRGQSKEVQALEWGKGGSYVETPSSEGGVLG